jgi:hypothetical protein
LRVKDYAGNPVAGARVLAFSEDWGIRSPGSLDNRMFWLTDSEGKLSLSIPVGKWSFFVVSGFDYAFSHPARALTAHEFGHTRTLRNPTFIAPDYFGESISTMLAIEGLSRLYGRKIWFWGTGFHDLFFYHIRGVPLSSRSDLIETSQFVLAYIQRKYGWDAHKRVLSGWSGEFSISKQIEKCRLQ